MNSNSKENYFQSIKPAQICQIQLLTGFLSINAAVLKLFKILLLLCALLCSGIIPAPTVYGQENNELNVVPTTSDSFQDMMKHQSLEKLGIDVIANRKLTLEEVRAVTQLSPSVANAIRDLPGCKTNTLPRNDDQSTGIIPLPFSINFFGVNFSQTYVNNNGNITFTGPLRTFTPFPLTGTSTPIIAPFFADVDTRNSDSGVVQFGNTIVDGQQAFCVNYINVGYFPQNVDKLNSFQVILIDRTDTGTGNFDIEFNYNKIQWETGRTGGLGGNSARAGYANGNATPGTFFELPGSGINGGLLDTNPTTGLTNNSLNSAGVPGRYTFFARNGAIVPCSYSFNPETASFDVRGGNGSFAVTNTAGTGCTWTAVSNADWLTTSSSGSGNGTVNYSVAENTSITPRTGTITVGGQPFTVTQEALSCSYSLNPTGNPNVPTEGGTFNFSFIANQGCPTSVSSNVPWITASSSGGVNGTITYTVEPNPTTEPRTGIITIGDQTFTVTQDAPVACTYSIAPTSGIIGSSGGNGSFTITAPTGCAWTAVSDSNWLITSGSGSGNGTILYTATANTATSSRIGRITVGGQTFTLTQAAAPACTYSVSPTSDIVEATSGTYSFNVFANPGCAWTATTSTPWITTTSSGTGNGTANYTVAANTGAARQGTITVNGQVFTVNQKSPTVTTYSISGRVTNGSNGLSGVRVVLSGPIPAETITDSDGNYRFSGLTPADYTVMPSLPGAIITPTESNIGFLNSDRIADFALAVCTYSLSASDKDVPSEESSGSFVVNGCGTIPWQAISNVPWIILSNDGVGAGTQPVGYFVQRNYGAARAGVINVNGQLYTITQAGFSGASANKTSSPQVDAPCGTLVADAATNLRRQVFSFSGGSSSFNVKTINRGNLPECRWSAVAKSAGNWIKVAKERGINDETVSFTVEENTTPGPRFGTIVVNGEEFTIVQTARQLPNCNFTLTPSSRDFSAESGNGSFGIMTPALCRWVSFIDTTNPFIVDWLKVDNLTRAEKGDGTRSFTIKANEGTKTNEGSIVVGNKVFIITQAAGELADCRWELSSRTAGILAGGAAAKEVNVITAAGCSWTTAATDAWIQIKGGVGATDGTISFDVAPNMGTTAREGRISITQDPSVFITITQAAAQTCSYTIDPGFQSVMNSGAAGTIQVTASDSCTTQQWSAVSNVSWIKIISGASGTRNGMTSFIVEANPTTVQRSGKITIAGRTFEVNQAAGNILRRTSSDFDGDGRADIAVFRPSNGTWYLLQSNGGFTGVQFGAAGDKLVPADYDGDGRTDLAVYRAGTWYLNRSTDGFTGVAFGESTDIPVPADYDGDGKADLAVWRPSNGTWYVYNLATNQVTAAQFGAATDKPVVGDFNGDGKSDYAVFRPSNGTWYIARPTGTPAQNFDSIQFGEAQDKPVAADYDGDGKTDVAVFRPSNGVWYLLQSTAGFRGVQFGFGTDLPTPADYDGDGKADVAVYRNGVWYLQQSTNGFTGIQFGAATDKPVPNAFVP